jgi:phage baseplate assembly protein W
MPSTFLGVGWKFPPGLDQGGQVAMSQYEQSVAQSIWIVLSTAPGERVMRPDFGCGIHALVFAPNTAGTAGRMTNLVQQALIRWEPRIELLAAEVSADVDDPTLLLVEITYRVRSTNNRFNLVYPFYLE